MGMGNSGSKGGALQMQPRQTGMNLQNYSSLNQYQGSQPQMPRGLQPNPNSQYLMDIKPPIEQQQNYVGQPQMQQPTAQNTNFPMNQPQNRMEMDTSPAAYNKFLSQALFSGAAPTYEQWSSNMAGIGQQAQVPQVRQNVSTFNPMMPKPSTMTQIPQFRPPALVSNAATPKPSLFQMPQVRPQAAISNAAAPKPSALQSGLLNQVRGTSTAPSMANILVKPGLNLYK